MGIDYVFTLVIDVADVHVFVIFGAEPLWMQLFLMLLSCTGAVYHLSPDRLSRAFIEIIILFCIRLHISVFILSHVQLDGYLLALANRTILGRLWAPIACTWLLLILPPQTFWFISGSDLVCRVDWKLVFLVHVFINLQLRPGFWLDDFALEDADGVVIIQSDEEFVTQNQILNLGIPRQKQLILWLDLWDLPILNRLRRIHMPDRSASLAHSQLSIIRQALLPRDQSLMILSFVDEIIRNVPEEHMAIITTGDEPVLSVVKIIIYFLLG